MKARVKKRDVWDRWCNDGNLEEGSKLKIRVVVKWCALSNHRSAVWTRAGVADGLGSGLVVIGLGPLPSIGAGAEELLVAVLFANKLFLEGRVEQPFQNQVCGRDQLLLGEK